MCCLLGSVARRRNIQIFFYVLSIGQRSKTQQLLKHLFPHLITIVYHTTHFFAASARREAVPTSPTNSINLTRWVRTSIRDLGSTLAKYTYPETNHLVRHHETKLRVQLHGLLQYSAGDWKNHLFWYGSDRSLTRTLHSRLHHFQIKCSTCRNHTVFDCCFYVTGFPIVWPLAF